MKYVLTRAITTVAMMILATAHMSADNNQKKEEVSCKTTLECKKVVKSLESQIDVFEKKGIENLTNEEFETYDALSDKVLSTQRKITAKQNKIIVKQKEEQEEIRKTNAIIDSIAENFK